jgi:hypothetical protein
LTLQQFGGPGEGEFGAPNGLTKIGQNCGLFGWVIVAPNLTENNLTLFIGNPALDGTNKMYKEID